MIFFRRKRISNSSLSFVSFDYRVAIVFFFQKFQLEFSATIIPDYGTDILDVRPILFHFLSKNRARKHHEGRDGGMRYEPGVRTLERVSRNTELIAPFCSIQRARICIIRTRCYQCGDICRWSGSRRFRGERNGDIKIDMTQREGERKKGE